NHPMNIVSGDAAQGLVAPAIGESFRRDLQLPFAIGRNAEQPRGSLPTPNLALQILFDKIQRRAIEHIRESGHTLKSGAVEVRHYVRAMCALGVDLGGKPPRRDQ